ncbi:hypothetical protein Tco_0222019 [Tanacetum coccineum]
MVLDDQEYVVMSLVVMECCNESQVGLLVKVDEEEFGEFSLEAMDDEEVALVDGVFDGALGALGDESWCFGKGVLVSSLVRSMNNCLGGMMVIFGLLEGLEVKALVDVMEVMVVDDE